MLAEDDALPQYPQAKLARFAPHSGTHAAIVDELGIHFVDIGSQRESLFVAQPGIESLAYSPRDTYVVTCEKTNLHEPEATNLKITSTLSGSTLAQFVWKLAPKESLASILFSPDESFALRRSPVLGKAPNAIELYKDGNFAAPHAVINARFQKKGATKSDPPIVFNGHFDGFQLCPVNEQHRERYLFAWQNADQMSIEETNGTVYVYDLNAPSFERSKFMIMCHNGQNIRIKASADAHAMLIWSFSNADHSGKSYYGQHQLQYV